MGNLLAFGLHILFPNLLLKHWFAAFALTIVAALLVADMTALPIGPRPLWVFPLAGEGLRWTFVMQNGIPSWLQFMMLVVVYILYFAIARFERKPKEQKWSFKQNSVWFFAIALLYLVGWAMLLGLLTSPIIVLPLLVLTTAPWWFKPTVTEQPVWSFVIRRGGMGFVALALLIVLITPLIFDRTGAEMPPQHTSTTRVIIDTDMAVDDYVAIYYLLRHPDVEVMAITSVHGVSSSEIGRENIERFIQPISKDIPVGSGASAPLQGSRRFPPLWVGAFNSAFRFELPLGIVEQPTQDALPLMADILQQYPDTKILALGPLTNVANLLAEYPELSDTTTIVIGSGTITITNPFSDGNQDWNTWVDPTANKILLNSGAMLYMIPMDVTHYELLFDHSLRTSIDNTPVPSNRTYRFMNDLIKFLLWTGFEKPIPIWDAATATTITNPEICRSWEDISIKIIEGRGEQDGFVERNPAGEPNVRVCTRGNKRKMAQIWADLLQGTVNN